jgi:hypothetical protein
MCHSFLIATTLLLFLSFDNFLYYVNAFANNNLLVRNDQRFGLTNIGICHSMTIDQQESDPSDISDEDAAANKEHEIKKQTLEVNLQLKALAFKRNRRSRQKVARKAYDLLRSVKHPDTVSYNSAIYLQTNNPELALSLLGEMEDIHQIQSQRNHQWYWKNSEGKLSREELAEGPPPVRVKPNVRSFSTVMSLFAKQGTVDGARQCEELLERLRTKFEKTGDFAYEPNTICLNTLLDAWAKTGQEEGATKCRRIFNEMGDLADTISLNTVLHAIARSGHPMAGQQAEEFFRGVDNITPNARSYSTCADAWSRSSCDESAERAHSLLLEAEALEKDPSRPTFKLNCVFYATVVNAYAWNKTDPFKAHKAFAILQRASRRSRSYPDSSPNVILYNCVLNCIANTSPNRFDDRIQSVDKHLPSLTQLVRITYRQLLEEEPFEPDNKTFGTVLKAIANLFISEPDYAQFCEEVFVEACKRGEVSYGVLTSLRLAAPSDLYYRLLPLDTYNAKTKKFEMHRIPKEWTCNVKGF